MSPGEEMLARACVAFQGQGYLHPTMWAIGEDAAAVAITTSEHAANVGPLVSTVLLGLMGQAVHALAVGSIHEVYAKDLNDDDRRDWTSADIASMAEVDPTIRTALVVSWFNLADGSLEAESSIASLVLDDEGTPGWEVRSDLVLDSPYEAMAYAAGVGHGYAADNAEEAMNAVAEATGWTVWIERDER